MCRAAICGAFRKDLWIVRQLGPLPPHSKSDSTPSGAGTFPGPSQPEEVSCWSSITAIAE